MIAYLIAWPIAIVLMMLAWRAGKQEDDWSASRLWAAASFVLFAAVIANLLTR